MPVPPFGRTLRTLLQLLLSISLILALLAGCNLPTRTPAPADIDQATSVPPTAPAATSIPRPVSVRLEQVGQLGGASTAVAVQDSYAYVNAGPRLFVMDISDRNDPVAIGQSDPLPGFEGVTVAGQYAYVAAADGGLRVIDISDPAAPSEVGSYSTQGAVWSVAIGQNTAFLAAADGLHVLDISKPTTPLEIGFLATPDAAVDVALTGGLAYIAEKFSPGDSPAERGGLRIVDVSTPSNPVQVGFFPMNPLQAGLFEEPTTPRGARAVAVVGNTAYLTYHTEREGGLRIVDVTDPANPFQLGDYQDYVYYISDLVVVGDPAGGTGPVYAYTTTGPNYGLLVLDVSDPANPTVVPDEVPGLGEGVAVAANTLFVGGGVVGGLQVVDISRPGAAFLVSSYRWPGDVRQVTVVGDTLYIIDTVGDLWLVDVSDPTQPVQLGRYAASQRIEAAAGQTDYVYLASSFTLQVIDGSDPARPVQVGGYETPDLATGVALAGQYAYLTAGDLLVADVSNPANPALAGSYPAPARIKDVVIAGDRAYVISDWVHVLDISNPGNPTELGSYDPSGICWDAAVAGNHAYLLVEDELRILDVSDAAGPLALGSYQVGASATHLAVAGEYAYLAGMNRLHVVDVFDPAAFRQVFLYEDLVQAFDLAAAGGYVYVADAAGGLVVLQLDLQY